MTSGENGTPDEPFEWPWKKGSLRKIMLANMHPSDHISSE
jgi:hypothetical protein